MEVTITKLTKTYGRHAVRVLTANTPAPRIRSIPVDRGKPRRFKVLSEALPTAEEFRDMMVAQYTVHVSSVVEDANSEVSSLQDEMEEWRDGIPEGLQGGSS